MTFPIVIPSAGYDGGFDSMLAVSLTGMGVYFGQHLCMDRTEDRFFDDEVLQQLNRDYLHNEISINSFIDRVRAHLDDRGGVWGFKFSGALSLLPLYQRIFPSMSIVHIGMDPYNRLQNIIEQCVAEDSLMSESYPQIWREISLELLALAEAEQFSPTLVIPAPLFDARRDQALTQLASWVGGDYRSGAIGKMVDSAERKLHYVYTDGGAIHGHLDGR